ncbi:MAG: hypothetical protein DHS20C18_36340 [Saprospiraceae bacterium]|nr:MAG: hypothetical protein DHS20C18_36340 [Saprospiraceae bacterium]
MRKAIWCLLFCSLALTIAAQSETGDTTIYVAVEEMPRFPVCEKLDTTLEFKRKCANEQLLAFIYQNINYPGPAIQENIAGTVVVSFVVEKDGSITYPEILKDIGGGCGEEAIRVISIMPEVGLKWVPGKNKGEAVRTRFNLPVKFRLEEAPPYSLVDGDTVYTVFEKALDFDGGGEGLSTFLDEKLDYPPSGNDSCLVGKMDIQVLIEADGNVRILDITDFSDLGLDFWYEAIDATTSSRGKWKPATFEGRKVPSAFDISLAFLPTVESCKTEVARYEKANQLLAEGAELFVSEAEADKEAGLAKMTEAVTMFPNDASMLLARGQAFLDLNRLGEACEDLTKARRIALVKWYDNILSFICRPQQEEEGGN